jgi:hypothetical protein
MQGTIDTAGVEEIRALDRMSRSNDAFLSTIANGTLALIEARRDAQVRAAIAEAACDAAERKIKAIREVLLSLPAHPPPPPYADILRKIALLVA